MKYQIRKSMESYEVKSYIHPDEVIPADVVDCSLGINPFGCTDRITADVYAATFGGMAGYPSYPYPVLRQAICDYLAPAATIVPEQLAIHTGSMGMIWDLDRLLIEDGTQVLAVAPTFSSATSDMRAMGAVIDTVALRESQAFQVNLTEIAARLTPSHRIVYLDNPNNPTGQVIPIDGLRELARQALAQDTYLLVDEAYGDFMELANSAVTLVNEYPNVIVIRTLSKGFGLAGIRTGYAVFAREFAPVMAKLPGEMAITEMAAQIAPIALGDREHIAQSRAKIAANKQVVLAHLTTLKASVTTDTVPIVLLYTEQDTDLYALLLRHGIKAERGEDFDGIGRRHVRFRVPRELDECLRRLLAAQKELEG